MRPGKESVTAATPGPSPSTPPLVGRRVVVVEDDASLRESLGMLLESHGFEVTGIADGTAAAERLSTVDFDALVLDLMLPGVDGIELCRQVRASSPVPILILTARTETSTLVASLECGADDYLTKPFDAAELVARLRALLRRSLQHNRRGDRRSGDLTIDADGYRLFKRGEIVPVSATEFRLLLELVDHAGQVLTREVLLERVWGYDYLGDSRLVDMAVKRLRDKIEDDPREPRYVATVRGVGYRFDGFSH